MSVVRHINRCFFVGSVEQGRAKQIDHSHRLHNTLHGVTPYEANTRTVYLDKTAAWLEEIKKTNPDGERVKDLLNEKVNSTTSLITGRLSSGAANAPFEH